MVELATADCDDDHEALIGWYTVLEEHLAAPFETQVLGVDVTVESIEVRDEGYIVALCVRGRFRQAIGILDLPLPAMPPEGAEWIAAYRHWVG